MRILKISLFTAAILFLNALFFIQVFSSFSTWKQTNALFSVTQINFLPYDNITPFRLPGRTKDLLIVKRPENVDNLGNYRFNIISPFESNIFQINYVKEMLVPINWTYNKPLDLGNTGEVVIPILGLKNKKILLELRNFEGKILERTIFEDLSLPFPSDNVTTIILGIFDIDSDGRKEVFWLMSAEWNGLPRGMAVHDLISGKKKWEFLYGAIPSDTIVKDIDSNGKMEIIFTAWASHNGFNYNGMNDDTSYIGVLDSTGKPIWIKESGSFYTRLFMAVEDVNNDGKFEIITARSCHRENNPDPGQIQIYDGISGNILHSFLEQDVSFINLYVADMNNDSNLEIITSDTRSKLWVWDHNLKTLREYNNNANIKVLGVEKIPGNSFPFIFTWCSLKNLRIFDRTLRPIFNFQVKNEVLNPLPIVRIRDGEKTSFILSADYTYMITPKSSTSFSDYLLLILSPFTAYFLGLLIFNFLLYFEYKKRKKLKTHYRVLMQEGINPTWMKETQETLHKMKSPLTAILWEAEKIDQLLEKKRLPKTFPLKLKKITQSILAGVNDLKIMNRLLMKFLQIQSLQLQEIQIKDILLELIDQYSANPMGKFSVKSHFPTPIPTFLADEEQLKEALLNIINNAIDAMPEGGNLNITAIFHKNLQKKNRKNIIFIGVEDTGSGIPQDKLDKIFEPYYTTKKDGTGIGLVIARRIIESHDGWIEVDSKEKVGTRFAIYFPVKNLPMI